MLSDARKPLSSQSWIRVLAALAAAASLQGQPLPGGPSPAARSALPFVDRAMFAADFWIRKLPDADRVILEPAQVRAFNARLRGQLPGLFFDLGELGPTISGARLRTVIEPPEYPGIPIYVDGKAIDRAYVDAIFDRMNLAGIQEENPVRYGYVVRRANMRRYPSMAFCTTSPADRIFDQLQSNSINPATPVAILHASRDGAWLYCCMYNYSGWMSAEDIAFAPDRAGWLKTLAPERFLVVTGSRLSLGHNPYSPELSELLFSMGARLPLVPEQEPAPEVIDHQNITGNYVVRLPTRGADGKVVFKLALVSAAQDVQDGFLPYTRATLLRQAFKSLGERYEWVGPGKDCSALLQDVFLCAGLELPRDSGQQAQVKNPADVAFDPIDLDYARRIALVRALRPGAELFWGGHVMLYVGEHEGRHYVIHNAGDYGDSARPLKAKSPWLGFEPVDLYQVVLSELTLQQSRNGKIFERLVAGKRYE
jgi:hypothetical protein